MYYSGLLVAYLTLREMDKCGGAKKFNWGLYYFHRIWRFVHCNGIIALNNSYSIKHGHGKKPVSKSHI